MFDYLARDRRRLRRGTRAFAREVIVGDACVFVDHGFQWDGARNVWLTRARASFIVGSGPAFELRPRSVWNRVFGLGWRHAAIDPYFDEFFAVRTLSPGLTWEALTTRARTLLVGSFEDGCLVSDGRHVTLWREGDFGRQADAEAAVELVAEVVSCGVEIMEPLRRLPATRYVPAAGPWSARRPPYVELAGSPPVEVGPLAVGSRPVIAVRAPCGRATEPFEMSFGRSARGTGEVDIAEGTVPGLAGAGPATVAPGARPMPSGLLEAARELGAARLHCDGHHVTMIMNGLMIERAPLLAAARLVRSWASGQLGVYR